MYPFYLALIQFSLLTIEFYFLLTILSLLFISTSVIIMKQILLSNSQDRRFDIQIQNLVFSLPRVDEVEVWKELLLSLQHVWVYFFYLLIDTYKYMFN